MSAKIASITLWVIAICLALCLATTNLVMADTPEGLDIVFIVDQSGSMGGEAAGCDKHPVPNDPNGMRFYGVQYAAEWLGRNQWLIHPDVTYQVAIVNFGSRAQAVNLGTGDAPRNWETIAPGSETEWLLQQATLEPKLKPRGLASQHLGDTNFLRAFRLARDLFAQLDDEGDFQRTHRRAIVVLTDGQPYVDEEGFTESKHMESVLELAEESFPASDYDIYVVAMNDAEAHYWDRTYAGYWANVTGDPDRAEKVRLNETDVGIRFREILLELTHDLPGEFQIEDIEIEAGPQVIPPYLAEVEFTFFKAESDETTTITDALGRDVKALGENAGVKVSGETGPIERVSVSNPEPGQWVVGVPIGSETKITMQKIPARGVLEKPSSVQYRDLPTEIVYQLGDIHGNPLPEYSDPTYQLQVTATMQVDGQSWPINLRLNGQSRYEGEFVPSTTGPHVVYVEAVSQDLSGKRIEVFAGKLNPFEVRSLTAETRLPGQRLTQFVPASLRFGVLDRSNLSAAVAADLSAEAIITDPTGQNWTVPLQPQQGSELAAMFTPTFTGTHQIHLIGKIQDAKGTEHVPLDVVLPPVNVEAPEMKVQVSSPPHRQYGRMTVNYELMDGAGNVLALDPAYQPLLEARLETAEGQPEKLLTHTGSGVFTAIFTPTVGGPQTLVSTFKITNPATGEQTLVSETRHDLYLVPTFLVDVQISNDADREQPVRSVLFQPQPLVVEAQLTADGQAVTAAQVMEGNPSHPLTIKVRDEQEVDRSQEMVWKPTNQPGLFRAEGENLGRGEYTIEVRADAPLKEDYLYGTPSDQLTIRRIENPTLVGGAIAGSALLLIGLVILGVLIIRAVKLTKHPCRGFLTITDQSGKVLWLKDLTAEGKKNRWTFDLGLEAPLSLIESLTITCNSDQESADSVVNAEAVLENGDEIGPYPLQPNSMLQMVTGISWLFKDAEGSYVDMINQVVPETEMPAGTTGTEEMAPQPDDYQEESGLR